MEQHQIDKLVDKIQNNELLVFCGAGISFNSGLPLANQLKCFILGELGLQTEDIDCLMKSNIPFEGFMQCLVENSGMMGISEIIDIFRNPQLHPTNTHFGLADSPGVGPR